VASHDRRGDPHGEKPAAAGDRGALAAGGAAREAGGAVGSDAGAARPAAAHGPRRLPGASGAAVRRLGAWRRPGQSAVGPGERASRAALRRGALSGQDGASRSQRGVEHPGAQPARAGGAVARSSGRAGADSHRHHHGDRGGAGAPYARRPQRQHPRGQPPRAGGGPYRHDAGAADRRCAGQRHHPARDARADDGGRRGAARAGGDGCGDRSYRERQDARGLRAADAPGRLRRTVDGAHGAAQGRALGDRPGDRRGQHQYVRRHRSADARVRARYASGRQSEHRAAHPLDPPVAARRQRRPGVSRRLDGAGVGCGRTGVENALPD
jgi:hypothetical protein